MEDIWMDGCRNLEISDDVARPWYERIRRKMVQGSGRFYHNWDELLLRKEEHLRDVSSNVLFAVFFQYYEFDGKRNCVEKNCEAFDEFCSEAGLKDTAMAKAVRKLLGDESIEDIPGNEEEANLLQDLDLLVLGTSPEEYKRYRDLLRKEYSHLDDDSYKQMRLKAPSSGPSTSREAEKQKTVQQSKPFVKFKDDKYKNRTKTVTRKQFPHVYSPGQIVTRKILRTIKKKGSITPRKQDELRKRLTSRNSNSFCDLTIKAAVKNVSNSPKKSKNSTDNDTNDDDCVLVESPAEIILIDDESTTNCNTSNAENISNCLNISNIPNSSNISDLLLKTYQPIGSSRHQTSTGFHQILHSTPKLKMNSRWGPATYYRRTLPVVGETSHSVPSTVTSTNTQTNEAVVIEDVNRNETVSNAKRKTDHDEDDSVIFVSEEVNNPSPPVADYIPLNTDAKKYPVTISSPKEPKTKRRRNELFNSKEYIQLERYNANAYNPNKDTETPTTKKRMVIVDGSNVAYHHALNKEFSVKGLKICLDYFEKLGHEVKAVVPQFRLQKLRSTDPAVLEKLHEEGKIVFTPCKNLPGKSSTSYDDRFILQLASELDAAIVSNDNYRDLIHENPAFKKIIENRVIGFTWCNDLFILPKDPYGKWGPALDTILNRS